MLSASVRTNMASDECHSGTTEGRDSGSASVDQDDVPSKDNTSACNVQIDRARAAALSLILGQCAHRDLAEKALEACQARSDPMEWAEEALLWMAEQDGIQMETGQLAEAMQVSLQEAEQRKASSKPLEEYEDEELKLRFQTSSLLPKLTASIGSCPLSNPSLRTPLLQLLELERNALRWYTNGGTRIYFDRLSEQCVEKARDGSQRAGAQAANGRKRKGGARGGGRGRKKRGSVCRSTSPEQPVEAALQTCDFLEGLAKFFTSEATTLEHAMYQMPSQGGEVPYVFACLNDAAAADDDVVILGERDLRDRKTPPDPGLASDNEEDEEEEEE
eukprot:jgi/Botrbrau1/1997/Bobra.0052s0039.1